MATPIITVFLVLFSWISSASAKEGQIEPVWPAHFQKVVVSLDKDFDGTFSIYIENLSDQTRFEYQSDQLSYLASTIKIFVAASVYRLVELNRINLEDTVKLSTEKYRDGRGPVNWQKEGKRIQIRKLLEDMIVESDNAATDILIDIVGVPEVEKTARNLGVHDLGTLTSMLDVRKTVFRKVHPLAGSLTAMDFIALSKEKNHKKKAALLGKLLGIPKPTFTAKDIRAAFRSFYRRGYNSASLKTFTRAFKALIFERYLSKEHRRDLLNLLLRCQTGQKRIKAGLPENWKFAHKTGTQYKRSCDAGIAFGPKKEKLMIAICMRDFASQQKANEEYVQLTKHFFKSYLK